MTSAPGRVLGIDLGERRIGVAVSDAARRVATPLVVVERTRDAARHRRAVAELVAEWEATLVVVGLPVSLDGTEGPAAAAAREEMAALADCVGVPVTPYDERLTTVTAHRDLSRSGLGGRQRRDVVDMVAASVLLQAWLDAHTQAQEPSP